MKFTAIRYNISAANCPLCSAYAQLDWSDVRLSFPDGPISTRKVMVSRCSHCSDYHIWRRDKRDDDFYMVWPTSGSVPIPNDDMPENIKTDYLEAGEIVEMSPRGAVALLRLAVQKLCKHLGEKGENINTDIKNLVSKGLHPKIQKALDSVRVTGNNAVHPGTIDLTDDRETAIKLFGFINVIVDSMITQEKNIDEFYEMQVPDKDKANIAKRDGAA